MATGFAIMGFGSGALVGAPFGVELMNHFKTAASMGVQETFLVMAGCYFVMMNFGAWIIRFRLQGWSRRVSFWQRSRKSWSHPRMSSPTRR